MADSYLINQIIVALIDGIGIWLAVTIYRNNPRGKTNRLFVWMVVFMFFWVNLACFSRVVYSSHSLLSLLMIKMAWFITPLFFVLLYFLSISLIQEEKKYQILGKIVLFLGVIPASAAGFTDMILKGIDISNGAFSLIYGKGILPFLAAVFFIMCATLYPLLKKYIQFTEKEKEKIKFFLIGIFIFYLANLVFNIFLPIVLNISWYYYIGDYSIIFLLGLTAFAMVKYEFLGIKVVLSEFLVGMISVLLLIDFVSSTTFFEYILKGVVFLAFLIAGYLLIKSVLREVKLREELEGAYEELRKSNQTLELRVGERTKELERKTDELEKWYRLTVGREVKMAELKKKIQELEKK